jgi:hypothetical protein
MRIFVVSLILILVSQGCVFPFTQPTSNDVIFYDYFSDKSNNWDQVTYSSGTTDYYNDAYRISINVSNYDAWANPGNKSFTDTSTEVDATKNSGPDDNDFGIVCRYTDTNQFYYAIISSDGYYAIMKMTSDGAKPVGEDSMLESEKIIQGTNTNHLRFDCIGSTLTLYVNRYMVDQQKDADYTSGNVGLIAGTFDTVGTDILFDNFIVYKP